ncbi:MAG: glycosyltransferase [Candidatus Omnitrophica bacterium]|nr:glycosyltransferase [Candidatus Omnitrophota bacterium]
MKKGQGKIKISVVVCTANYSKLFKKTIASILKNNFRDFELIIVDQNKTDDVNNLIKKFYKNNKKIIYLKDNGTGLSRARNIGWKRAKGEIISYTDDDAYVDKNWLKNIWLTFKKDKKIGIVGGKIIPVYKNNINSNDFIPKEFEYILPSLDLGNKIKEYDGGALPPGVNYSIRNNFFEKLGGFDEFFGSNNKRKLQIFGEDSDMTIRVKKKEYKVIYNYKVIVYHPIKENRLDINFLKNRFFSEGYTDCLLFLKHNKVSLVRRFFLFINKFKELFILILNKNNFDEFSFIINTRRILGYIYGLFSVIFNII